MSGCNNYRNKWYAPLLSIPKVRYFNPLVRLNGLEQDMPEGSKFHPCWLPDTIASFDPCTQILTINGAKVDLSSVGDIPCAFYFDDGSPILFDSGAPIYYDGCTSCSSTI